MKTEACNGTTLRPHETGQEVTFDGLQRGDRALCHSCSDKIPKWNVLGVQGALLSRLMPPVYLAGVVVGDLFDHDNLTRALCCRNQRALYEGGNGHVSLPAPFAFCHPRISEAPKHTPRHEKIKNHGHSINWACHDSKAEMMESKTGLMASGDTIPSRICKQSLFGLFSNLQPKAKERTYNKNKRMAEEYQESKFCWLGAMERANMGHWMHKPAEVDNFVLEPPLESIIFDIFT